MSARSWLRAARPLAHANIAPPLILGQAFAWALGHGFEPLMAVVAHAFGVCDHLFIVFTNDVADRDADALNTSPTPFSGGSRVLQEGALRPRQLAIAALVAAATLVLGSVAAGIALDRPWLPLFALAAIALLAAYSLPPLRLSYRGYGELLQGLGVGLVLPLLGFYAQAGTLDAPWPAFAPLVLFAFVSNILTALPDAPADRLAKKASWPVRRGEPAARRDALILSGVGLLLASQLGPPLGASWTVVVPPSLLLIGALRYAKTADATNRAGCLRFVILTAGGLTMAHLAWALALALRPS